MPHKLSINRSFKVVLYTHEIIMCSKYGLTRKFKFFDSSVMLYGSDIKRFN